MKAFPNRWPALGDGRAEVVLYTPDHDASFASLGTEGALAVIDLWADRTVALRADPDVEFVLVFENRGSEVGATISHPHGQIYAFDHVPARPARREAASWSPDRDPGDRLVLERDGWQVVVPFAPVFPVSLSVEPLDRIVDVPSMGTSERRCLAGVLVDVLGRLDRLHGQALPYMMWVYQAPSRGGVVSTDSWLQIEIVSPWRSAGVPRHIAAAEVACEEYFNPVIPEDLAARLRSC